MKMAGLCNAVAIFSPLNISHASITSRFLNRVPCMLSHLQDVPTAPEPGVCTDRADRGPGMTRVICIGWVQGDLTRCQEFTVPASEWDADVTCGHNQRCCEQKRNLRSLRRLQAAGLCPIHATGNYNCCKKAVKTGAILCSVVLTVWLPSLLLRCKHFAFPGLPEAPALCFSK